MFIRSNEHSNPAKFYYAYIHTYIYTYIYTLCMYQARGGGGGGQNEISNIEGAELQLKPFSGGA